MASFLLRVVEQQVLRVEQRYELLDLASGQREVFASLPALQRHLRELARKTGR